MKKLLSLSLAFALMLTAGVPAAAAEAGAAAGRAAAVTLAVKEKLELDTGEYTEFNSSFSESVLEPTWRLYWSGDNGSLSISVTEDGRVESYSRYSYGGSPVARPVTNRGRFTPSFPVLTRDMALETAQAFLDKALEADEAVELERGGKSDLGAGSYSFSGTILVNGLPSPFSFSVRVGEDNTVTSFYRSGTGRGSILEDVPAPDAAVTARAAGASLRDTFSFRLEYVLSDDGETAVLRYLPQSTHDFYVDARTGELVDLTALYAGLSSNQMSPEVSDRFLTADNAVKGELTPAELEGVAKLEGVLSKEELDAGLRKLTALGLDKYSLGNVSYSVNSETGEVTARLQYTRQVGESFWRRTVTADGKTAALKSVSSSFPWKEEAEPTVSAAQAQANAEAFLAAQCGEKFAKTALYNGESALAESDALSRSFHYAQKENGYFFPTNSLTVGVDHTDGSICTYYDSFDCDVPFASPAGIVDLDAAKDAWLGTYDVTLQYLAVPKVLDPAVPEYQPLTEQGYSYLYTLELAYRLERGSYARGVDAHTGQALVSAPAAEKLVSYDDLGGHWIGEKAQRLAQFNVGWLGGSMEPDKALTQLDLVALLVSTNGWLFDPAADDADDLYRRAYSMGILTEDQRDDTAAVDRCALVKLLLDCTGYGDVAQLPGIFRCSFADAGDIPEAYLGYVALAWALGLVEGDSGNRFCPTAPATRAEAAAVLYRYLDR